MTYTVRSFKEEDRDWVVGVACYEMISNHSNRPDLYNEQVLDLLFTSLQEESTGFICELNGVPVGVVGGKLIAHPLNPNTPLLFELIWFVDEEHRGSRAGYLLLKAYTELVSNKGAEGILTLKADTELRDKSLNKLGWFLDEKHYKKAR